MRTATKNPITEGNKLIAQFLGYNTKDHWWFNEDKNLPALNADICFYDKSFDWLIPVVEKIESKGFNSKVWYILERNKFQAQFFEKDFAKEIEVTAETRIEAVYQAVIAFINWYHSK